MTDREIMQQALDTLETADESTFWVNQESIVKALRERLAQPEQEPVAWTLLLVGEHNGSVGKAGEKFVGHPKHYERVDVYKSPPHRKPLTDEQATKIVQGVTETSPRPIGAVELGLLVLRAIEAAHNIKENT